MVRVGPHAKVETFLAGQLDEVLVGADTGGFQGFRAQLLIFVGDQVNAQREVVDRRALSAQVEDSDLGIGHTTVEPGFRVRLGVHCQLCLHDRFSRAIFVLNALS